MYHYRAVDKNNKTVDFYLSLTRDTEAAKAFFEKALESTGRPTVINSDKSGANLAGIQAINKKLVEEEHIKNIFIIQSGKPIKRANGSQDL